MTHQHGFLHRTMTRLISRLPLPAAIDDSMQEIVSGTAVALGLRVAGVGLAFVFNVVLARFIGAEGTGIYYQAFAVISFAVVISQLGLDNTLLRFVAANFGQRDWPSVRGVIEKSILLASAASIVVTIVIASTAELIANVLFSDPQLTVPIRLLSFAILPFSLSMLYGIMLRAAERIEASVLVASVLIPLIQLGLIIILVRPLALTGAVLAYVIAALAVFVTAVVLWRRATPQLRSVKGQFSSRLLLSTAWPLFGIAILNSVRAQVDTVLLGAFADSATVGIYGAAKRLSLLASFVLVAINTIVAPKFALLHAKGDKEALALLVQRITRLTAILALPILLPLVVIPEPILSMFGPEFVAGSLPLAILAVGEFVNMATGSVGYLLIMTGNGTAMRNTVLISVSLSIVLNIVMIPLWGATGAAISSAVGLILMNLMSTVLVYRKLSILVLPISI